MRQSVNLDAERVAFVERGISLRSDVVRPAIMASWLRCRAMAVPPDHVSPKLIGYSNANSDISAAARTVFDSYIRVNSGSGCCLVMLDTNANVTVRCDDVASPLGQLLDRVRLAPGSSWTEESVGTSAGPLALIEGTDLEVYGAEHYVADLGLFSEAAALVHDPRSGEACGAVLVVCHESTSSGLQLALARMRAQQVAERLTDGGRRHMREVFESFSRAVGPGGGWVMASDANTCSLIAPCELSIPSIKVRCRMH